tara:strand:+ start:2181 stop:3197 length:1017 start_codon:yes stop_codon:yes gene_type:complete
MDFQKRFYEEYFFPYIIDNNISTIIDLGDAFENRKQININNLKEAKEMFYDRVQELDILLYCIVGNHTSYFKNSIQVNTMDILFKHYNNIVIVDEPIKLVVDDASIILCPWICPENHNNIMEFLSKTKVKTLMGHFEIQGFEMYKGGKAYSGLDSKIFNKFDTVYSGHFHHKSTKDNITYLGNPYEMFWNDFEDPRGFHIFDTETKDLTFIENPNRMFHKLFYDDVNDINSLEELTKMEFSEEVRNGYVKVIIKERTNPMMFDLYMNKLSEMDCGDIKIVDSHMNLDAINEETLIDESEDVLTTLKKYIAGVDEKSFKRHKLMVEHTITNLYNEAIDL